jgi:hypothetical protein
MNRINIFKLMNLTNLTQRYPRSLIAGVAGLMIALLPLQPASSVTVSPTGVNIKTFGATTVFLTYIGLNGFTTVEALWCGAINSDQSCVPGTVFGRLPKRSDRGQPSGGNNYTDIMTIPPSIARKAYQDAVQGASSEFFYVRRFVSNAGLPDTFVAVTCRLAGGGARVPLALTNVKLRFNQSNPNQPIPVIPRDQPFPAFQAEVTYNGTGRLKGRWEVVLPGDPPPTDNDLLTEATLPIEQRALQQRYTVIGRFDTFLMPTGRVTIPGPSPRRVPNGIDGLHLVLFRVEASDDKEGDSATGLGIVKTGGVASFPLPVLRYYVGSSTSGNGLNLLEPVAGARLPADQVVQFSWRPLPNAEFYRLEVRQGEKSILAAVLNRQTTSYTAPPWLKEQAGQELQWQVQAISKEGKPLVASPPQAFFIQK